MGYAAGWRRTEGPKAGEWFLDAYWYSFSATGEDLIDELLSALAWAGKRYHHTEEWGNPTGENEDGPSSIDEIQAAAKRAADEIARLRALVERREKQIVWCVRHEAHMITERGIPILDWTPDPDLAVGIAHNGTDAGLLAAVDEATKGDPNAL